MADQTDTDAGEPNDDVQQEMLDQIEGLDPDVIGNADDDVYDPPEGWSEANEFGTTLREEQEGEPIEQKLAREQPDFGEADEPAG